MSDDDGKDWFDGIVAASKEAAGLPADWGTDSSPLTPEEEAEDGPRPPRLRGGMTTADLLPSAQFETAIFSIRPRRRQSTGDRQ